MRLVRDTFVLFMVLVLTASTFQGPQGWENEGLFPWEDPNRLLLTDAQIAELSFIIRGLPLLEDARITFKHLYTSDSPSGYQDLQFLDRLDGPEVIRSRPGFGESLFVLYFENREPLDVSVFTRSWDETNLMITTADRIGRIIGSLPLEVTNPIERIEIVFGFGPTSYQNGILTFYVYTMDVYQTIGATEEVLFDLLLQEYLKTTPFFPEFSWVQAIIDDGAYVSQRATESDLLDRTESIITYYGLQTNPERYSEELLSESAAKIAQRIPLLTNIPLTSVEAATTQATLQPLVTPYTSTIYEFADAITFSDPTLLDFMVYNGSGIQNIYDRRIDAYADTMGYAYTSTYRGGKTIDVFVNEEFLSEPVASSAARYYSRLLGQLPISFIHAIDHIWIHLGNAQLGGGNRTLLIHTDKAGTFEKRQILEEVLLHEVSHTLFDFEFGAKIPQSSWEQAQALDNAFISDYGEEFPIVEDPADTMVAFYAARKVPERFNPVIIELVERMIPNRLDLLEQIDFDRP